jgi:hypothetical protein
VESPSTAAIPANHQGSEHHPIAVYPNDKAQLQMVYSMGYSPSNAKKPLANWDIPNEYLVGFLVYFVFSQLHHVRWSKWSKSQFG